MGKKGGKSTSKKTKESIRIKQQQLNPPKQGIKLLKYLTSTTAIVSFLISVAGFLFLVYPRISVYPDESLDSYKPFETPFVIKNDGYLPVSNIKYILGVKDITLLNGTHLRGNNFNIFNAPEDKDKIIPILRSNTSSPIFLNSFVGMPYNLLDHAEIYVKLKYRPYFVPYTFTEIRRFKTEQFNGRFMWREYYVE